MTISSTNRQAGPYSGNDITVAFPFAFKVFSSADLLVKDLVTATGIESTLSIVTHYTAALNSDQNANPGGTITLVSALASGHTLTITSDLEPLQSVDLTNQGGFYPRVINDALDKLTILCQQAIFADSKTLQLPSGSVASTALPIPGAGKFLRWNLSGDAIEAIDGTGTAPGDFVQSGTGAVARSVQSKLGDVLTSADYNSLQNLLDAGAGRRVRIFGPHTLTTGLTITAGTTVELDASAVIDFSGAPFQTVLFTAAGTESAAVALSANAAAKATAVQVAALPAGCAAGAYVRVASNAIFDAQRTNTKTGEITRVLSVTGTGPYTINVADALTFAYSTTDTAVVSVITPAIGVNVVGSGRIVGGGAGKQHIAFHGFMTHTALIGGLQIEGCELYGIWLQDDIQSQVTRNTVRDANYAGIGYGVVLDNACVGTVVSGNHLHNCRHATTLANSTSTIGISNGTVFRDNHAFSATGDAFDTHAAHWNVTFDGNVVHSTAGAGINIECPKATVTGNRILQAASHAIVGQNWADYQADYLIHNNIVESCVGDGIRLQEGAAATAEVQSISIQGNRVNASGIAVYVHAPSASDNKNAVIANNPSLVSGSAQAAVYLESLRNFVVAGNHITPAAGAYGLRARDCTNGNIVDNTVQLPSGTNGGAIYLNASGSGLVDRVTVSGNRLSGSSLASAKGLLIDNTATNCTVTDDNDFLLAGTPIQAGTGTGHDIAFPVTSLAYTLPSLAAGANDRQLISVAGAKVGDMVDVSFSLDLGGMVLTAYATGTNAVRVQCQNITTATINLGAGTLYVRLRRARA